MCSNSLHRSLTPDSAQTNSAQTAIKTQPTDLQAVINRTLRSLRPRLKSQSEQRGIQVVCDYGDLLAVECSAEIDQVFTALIAQAIEAVSPQADAAHTVAHTITVQRPQVTIRTMQIPDPQGGNPRVVVCVADNGAEISLEEQSQIFAAAGKRSSSALRSCYEIVVHQHGGDLQCYSQASGPEFWVELPVKQARSLA